MYLFFGTDLEETHKAAADINATAKCIWKARKRRAYKSLAAALEKPCYFVSQNKEQISHPKNNA